MTPASRDLRAALVRHIDLPAVAADDKTLGQRLAVGSCGGPSAPAPLAAAPVLPLHTPSSSGARGGAGAFNPLEHGGVFDRPACVDRVLRGMGWRTRIAIVVVAVFLASGVVAVVAACGGI